MDALVIRHTDEEASWNMLLDRSTQENSSTVDFQNQNTARLLLRELTLYETDSGFRATVIPLLFQQAVTERHESVIILIRAICDEFCNSLLHSDHPFEVRSICAIDSAVHDKGKSGINRNEVSTSLNIDYSLSISGGLYRVEKHTSRRQLHRQNVTWFTRILSRTMNRLISNMRGLPVPAHHLSAYKIVSLKKAMSLMIYDSCSVLTNPINRIQRKELRALAEATDIDGEGKTEFKAIDDKAEELYWSECERAYIERQQMLDIQLRYFNENVLRDDKYKGKAVAVLNCEVIDSDLDFESLFGRIRTKYPREVVLIKEVQSRAKYLLLSSPSALKLK
jgi:hypothetical protein